MNFRNTLGRNLRFYSIANECTEQSQTMIENHMLKRYNSYSPWIERSAGLVTLMTSGFAVGISTAVGTLYVLRNVPERPVTRVPIYATATAPVPAVETVGVASEMRSSPTVGEATAVSTSDNGRSTWSLQLIGDSSETRALAEYRKLQKRFPAILGSRTPVVLKKELGGRGSVFWYQVRLTEDSRERANALCTQLRSAGGECLVLND